MQADKQIVESIQSLVDYLYEDEEKDWEGEKSKNHIFNDVRAVSVWLDGHHVNRCANCGGKTKYPKYCTAYACRKVAGTQSMYNRRRTG
jgi:hypothetical protein